MQIIKTMSFYLLLGIILTYGSFYLNSEFLTNFVLKNLLTILIALLAINLTTLGIVFSKLEDIATRIEINGGKRPSFKKVQKEAFLSIKEQLAMIVITIIISILYCSQYCEQYNILKHIATTILNTVLVWDLHVLYDTSSSVFTVLNAINSDLKK